MKHPGLLDLRAAVCHGIGEPLRLEAVQLVPPAADEVSIEIEASGLRHSDYHVVTGTGAPDPRELVSRT